MIDNSTKWLVRGNAVVTVIILLTLIFGGHGDSNKGVKSLYGSTITANGLITNAPSSGTSNFNNVEADYGFFDTSSAASSFLGTVAFSGTTTVAQSPDGFVAWAGGTVTATGTAKLLFNNTNSPMLCSAGGNVYSTTTGSFSPGLVLVLGTTTGASTYSAGLLSSTTIATTTGAFGEVKAITYAAPFVLRNGESITGTLADVDKVVASSTYFSNRSLEVGFNCRTLGQ